MTKKQSNKNNGTHKNKGANNVNDIVTMQEALGYIGRRDALREEISNAKTPSEIARVTAKVAESEKADENMLQRLERESANAKTDAELKHVEEKLKAVRGVGSAAAYAAGVQQEMRKNEKDAISDYEYATREVSKLNGGVGLSDYEKQSLDKASHWEVDGSPVPEDKRYRRYGELLSDLIRTSRGKEYEAKIEALRVRLATALPDEELIAVQAELGELLANDPYLDGKKVGPTAEENANPDIKPKSQVEQLMENAKKLFGEFASMKMPAAAEGETGALPEGSMREFSKMLYRTSEASKRTAIFTRLCEDKDLMKMLVESGEEGASAGLLDRFRFFERYAPGLALDFDLAKDFLGSKQDLSIGSAIGLVKAEQTLINANTRRMVKNTLLVAAAGAGGYLLAMSIIHSFKKGA